MRLPVGAAAHIRLIGGAGGAELRGCPAAGAGFEACATPGCAAT